MRKILDTTGLGIIASGARLVTDEMFMSAARTLANLVSKSDLEQGSLYPALPRIREVSARIAAEVAQVAYQRGLTAGKMPNDVQAYVRSHMYEPDYCNYIYPQCECHDCEVHPGRCELCCFAGCRSGRFRQ